MDFFRSFSVVGAALIVFAVASAPANAQQSCSSAVGGPEYNLMDAIRKDDIAGVQAALRSGADVNCRLENGIRALSVAVGVGRLEMVSYLISIGADVNARDSIGLTALHTASFVRTSEEGNIVRLLIQNHADLNAQDYQGITPLINTAGNDNVDVARALLEGGADTEIKPKSGRTALFDALHDSSINVMALLLAHGADVDSTNDTGMSVLQSAKLMAEPPGAREISQRMYQMLLAARKSH